MLSLNGDWVPLFYSPDCNCDEDFYVAPFWPGRAIVVFSCKELRRNQGPTMDRATVDAKKHENPREPQETQQCFN